MSDKEACSRIEQRSVIKFLVAEGCKAVEIHRRMSTVYGATCSSRKNIYKWVKYSNTSPNGSPWSGST